ncbi:MAG: YjzC family protein [Planctomycetota bacterium]
MSVSSTKTRWKTGEVCVFSGHYRWDGYLDGTRTPEPRPEEKEIPLSRGERFPPIRSCGKACWWKLIRRI